MDRAAMLALPRKELQALAKKHGVRANGSNASIVEDLQACLDGAEPRSTKKLKPKAESARVMQIDDDDVPDQNRSGHQEFYTLTPSTATQDLSLSLAALKLRSRPYGVPPIQVTATTTAPAPVAGHAPAPAGQSATPEGKKAVPSLSLSKLPNIKLPSGPGTSRKPSARGTSGTSIGGSQTHRAPDTVQAKDSGPAHSTFDTTALPPITSRDVPKLWGMAPLMQQLHSMVGLDSGANTARGATQRDAQGGLILPPLQGFAIASRAVVLSGPPGNGKRSMVHVLAHELGAKYVSVDLRALLSSSDPEKAGDKIRHACQEVLEVINMRTSTAVLMVNDLGVLSSSSDRVLSRACCRAKAELLLGLGQIRSAAASKAGKRVRAVLAGIVHSNRDADMTLVQNFLNQQPPDQALLQVPQASRDCREAILYQLMSKAEAELTASEMDTLTSVTEGMSAEDVISMCELVTSTAASVPTPVSQVHCVAALTAMGLQAA